MKKRKTAAAPGEMTSARRVEIDRALKAGKTPAEIVEVYERWRLNTFKFELPEKREVKLADLRRWVDERAAALTAGGEFLTCPVCGPVALVDLRLSQSARASRDLAFSIPVRGRGVVAREEDVVLSWGDDGLYHLVAGRACRAIDTPEVREVLGDFDEPETGEKG